MRNFNYRKKSYNRKQSKKAQEPVSDEFLRSIGWDWFADVKVVPRVEEKRDWRKEALSREPVRTLEEFFIYEPAAGDDQ